MAGSKMLNTNQMQEMEEARKGWDEQHVSASSSGVFSKTENVGGVRTDAKVEGQWVSLYEALWSIYKKTFERELSHQSKDQAGPGHFRLWLKPQSHGEVDAGARTVREVVGEKVGGVNSCRERKREKPCGVTGCSHRRPRWSWRFQLWLLSKGVVARYKQAVEGRFSTGKGRKEIRQELEEGAVRVSCFVLLCCETVKRETWEYKWREGQRGEEGDRGATVMTRSAGKRPLPYWGTQGRLLWVSSTSCQRGSLQRWGKRAVIAGCSRSPSSRASPPPIFLQDALTTCQRAIWQPKPWAVPFHRSLQLPPRRALGLPSQPPTGRRGLESQLSWAKKLQDAPKSGQSLGRLLSQ